MALGATLATLVACEEPPPIDLSGPTAEWPAFGGSEAGLRHSPLTQITPANVTSLEVAWEYRFGDRAESDRGFLAGSLEVTPIVAEGRLYACSPRNRLAALDAETGEPLWTFDPGVDASGMWMVTCRGVSTWLDPGAAPDQFCRRRIYMGTLDAKLWALDAETGRPCDDFGEQGHVDLRHGMGEFRPGEYAVTSPPLVIDGKVITGALVLDNIRTDIPGGVVRAFDARSGELAWAWDPVPPGTEPGNAERGYSKGTPNAWSVLSGDPELGLVYVPTGNPSPDFYGGERKGNDHYGSSVVALKATTGEVAWHFQTVHHDVWDYDVPSQPVLYTSRIDGREVPALAQTTKMGLLFLFDRRDGTPLFEIEERPVPQGGVVGETLSPTQPFPTKPPPLHPTHLTADEAFGFTFWDRRACRRRIEGLRNEGLYTPPDLGGTVQMPGFTGGQNWGGAAVDPDRDLLIVNGIQVASIIELLPRADEARRRAAGEPIEPQLGTPYAMRRDALLSPAGSPCNAPPWGTLSAVDLKKGEILWQVPLGTSRDTAPWPMWWNVGVPSLGGPIVTATGLAFIGGTTDDFLRAFDVHSGRELWRGRLPAGGQATPMTYRTRPDGRQFVVVAAGGHGLMRTTPGDSIVAFALPQ